MSMHCKTEEMRARRSKQCKSSYHIRHTASQQSHPASLRNPFRKNQVSPLITTALSHVRSQKLALNRLSSECDASSLRTHSISATRDTVKAVHSR